MNFVSKFLADQGIITVDDETGKEQKQPEKSLPQSSGGKILSQETPKVVAPTERNPETDKFINIFLARLHRDAPKFFEMQTFLHKFEKTISAEKERFSTALTMTNVSQEEMLKLIDVMGEALDGEVKTASSQVKKAGERELSEKQAQVEETSKQIDDRKKKIDLLNQEIANFETTKKGIEDKIKEIQTANDEVANSANQAATEVQTELTSVRNKIAQFCV
jgi:chromosome segregation ATPase